MRIVSSKVAFTYEEAERLLDTLNSFGDPKKIAFLDIETTGFSRSYDTVYLVGFLSYGEGGFTLRQILAEDYREEGRLLETALGEMTGFDHVITYNGDMFDLPFLFDRAKRYRIFKEEYRRFEDKTCSLDLLKHFRSVQSLFGWPNLKLKTVEACLGIGRQDPFDGGQLIDVYDEYTKTNDERLEAVLLLHNYEDIQHLCGLMKVEALIRTLQTGKAKSVSLKDRTITVEWDRRIPLSLDARMPLWKTPKEEEPVPARLILTADSVFFSIVLPSCGRALYYYLPNPEDYYFIPAENALVHRSLAAEVPGSERRKAKKEECRILVYDPCTSQEEFGTDFFAVRPPLEKMELKTYRPSFKSKECYAKASEFLAALEKAAPETLDEYIKQYLIDFVGKTSGKGRTT